MPRRSARTAPLLVAAALMAAGCGSTDEPPETSAATGTTPRTAPSKQEFIRASAAICKRADRDIGAFIPLGSDPTTRRANRTGIITVIRRQNDDLHALGTPEGAPAGVFDDIHRAVEAVLDRAQQDGTTDIERSIDEALAPFGETLAEYTPGCG